MDTVGDPGFKYHVAIAQVWGLVALRLAGGAERTDLDNNHVATVGGKASSSAHGPIRGPVETSTRSHLGAIAGLTLPMNMTLQAEAIKTYIVEAKARTNGSSHVDYSPLDAASAAFAAAATKVMAEKAAALAAGGGHEWQADGSATLVAALNERLAYTERRFLSADGLPGRKYFKHVLQAPGLYTGYAPKTLPGLYDAVTTKDWNLANKQARVAAARILAAAKYLRGELSGEEAD